jgi:hypothetical protein
MKKLSKSIVLGCVLSLSCLPPVCAQTPTNAPTNNSAIEASRTAPVQAPDEVTNKITDLVHAGKYVEAQQLTTGLLLAYPNDQRLIKAKALLDRLVAPADSTGTPPSSSAPTGSPSQPLPSKASELTGMDRVEFDSLIELGREAQQATDLDQQKKVLHDFMDRSSTFLEKHPDEMLLWQLRAASAISLDEPVAAYDAGQKLLAAGAADSKDSNLRRLLAQLNLKGWMDKERVTTIAAERKLRSETEMMAATAVGLAGISTNTRDGLTGNELKIGGYAPDTFVITDHSGKSQAFRYDQIQPFQTSVCRQCCHMQVVLQGKPPHGIFGWNAHDLIYLFWAKQECSKAEDFVKALSTMETLAKQATSRESVAPAEPVAKSSPAKQK